MKILVASDKFKGSLTAVEACAAISEGLREALPDPHHEIRCAPIADGGDGVAETLLAATGGRWIETKVRDPLGAPLAAGYALLGDGKTAVIEMAKASGLVLLGNRENDPFRASTYGTGQLIQHAIEAGASEIILGIGGSATNDGGTGLAEALGYRFEDANGAPIENLPEGIELVARIVPPDRSTFPRVVVACDVINPLLGPNGCTRIYGPQKGVLPEDLSIHEERLAHLVGVTGEGHAAANRPGAGAAGGLGFGALVFLGAELVRGFDLVAERLGLADAVAEADLVITGEGCLDAQSLEGKAPHGVIRLARAHSKATVAFCGRLGDGSLEKEFGPIVEIRHPGKSLEENMARAGELLREAASRFMHGRLAAEA